MKSVLCCLLLLLTGITLFGQQTCEVIPTGIFKDNCTQDGNRITVDLAYVSTQGTLRDIEFMVINRSDTPLVFDRVTWAEPMCGPTYPRDPIAPGDTASIKYFCGMVGWGGRFQKTSVWFIKGNPIMIQFVGNYLPREIKLKQLVNLTPDPNATNQYIGLVSIENEGNETLYFTPPKDQVPYLLTNSQKPYEGMDSIPAHSKGEYLLNIPQSTLDITNRLPFAVRYGSESWPVFLYLSKEGI